MVITVTIAEMKDTMIRVFVGVKVGVLLHSQQRKVHFYACLLHV